MRGMLRDVMPTKNNALVTTCSTRLSLEKGTIEILGAPTEMETYVMPSATSRTMRIGSSKNSCLVAEASPNVVLLLQRRFLYFTKKIYYVY